MPEGAGRPAFETLTLGSATSLTQGPPSHGLLGLAASVSLASVFLSSAPSSALREMVWGQR